MSVSVYVFVSVCVREREREKLGRDNGRRNRMPYIRCEKCDSFAAEDKFLSFTLFFH